MKRNHSISAIVGSLVLHALLIAAFLIQLGGGGQGGGQFDRGDGGTAPSGSSVSVTLVAASPLMRTAALAKPETEAADPLQSLMSKALEQGKTTVTEPTPPSPAALESLIAAADRAAKPSAERDSGGAPAEAAVRLKWAAVVAGASGSEVSGPDGDLLAQVEPCWRRALGASSVPVTLEVALDRSGRIAGAPKVASLGLADEGDARRVAVERALQAVAACLPFRATNGANPRGVYTLAFGVSGR